MVADDVGFQPDVFAPGVAPIGPVPAFGPENAINRAEAMKILFKGANIETLTVGVENPFTDVDPQAWYYPYIMAAYKNKIVEGYPTEEGTRELRPDQSITRAEFAKIAVVADSM